MTRRRSYLCAPRGAATETRRSVHAPVQSLRCVGAHAIIAVVREQPRQIYASVRTGDRSGRRPRSTTRTVVVVALVILAVATIIVIIETLT